MKYILEVCLVALAATISPHIAAQSPKSAPQVMQQGISVELPVARNAVPMSDADQEDSLIVTVTDDGTAYFAVDPISPSALAEKVRGSLSNPPEKKLYIKADARTPYANVMKILETLRSPSVNATTLLTSHQVSSHEGTPAPPYGLAVRLGPPQLFGSEASTVQVLNSGQQRPSLKINNEDTPWTALQNRLSQLAQNRSQKVVLVNADGTLPFSDVVNVIDVCRSAAAQVVLVTPELQPPGTVLNTSGWSSSAWNWLVPGRADASLRVIPDCCSKSQHFTDRLH
jgi:biopolymer transport protein TolR